MALHTDVRGFKIQLQQDYYLLTYVAITTRLSGFGLSVSFSPGASASCAPRPVGHTKRSQGLFNLIFPTRTRSSLPPMTADYCIKLSSRRSVYIHPNDMAEPAEPLDIKRLATYMSLKSSYSSRLVRIR